MKEEQTKLVIGDWLEGNGFRIFDERPNRSRPRWGVFRVFGIERGKHPDLVVQGRISCGTKDKGMSFVAIEVKPCFKHHDVLDGFDAVLGYFSDYWWGAKYVIERESVPITAFVLATHFSPSGYLFQQEGNLPWQITKKGPWDSYPMTFTIARLLWRQKDNLVKRCQSLVSIPKIEKRISAGTIARPIPDVGVLIKHPNPAKKGQTLLMLSENPYHWRFDGCNIG